MNTKVEQGTALDYRIKGDSKVTTVSFYGDTHATDAQTYFQDHGIQDHIKSKTIQHDGKADFHQFRPIFREVAA